MGYIQYVYLTHKGLKNTIKGIGIVPHTRSTNEPVENAGLLLCSAGDQVLRIFRNSTYTLDLLSSIVKEELNVSRIEIMI